MNSLDLEFLFMTAPSERLLLPRQLGPSDRLTSALGLGCSRLGSILGLSGSEASRLIGSALERGINFFDTADIYGQGESERILGTHLRKNQAIIATKIGQRFPPIYRALNALKRPLAPLLRASKSASRVVRVSRAKPLMLDFRPSYLNAAVEKSLKRLRRDAIDLLFLHNPEIEQATASETLDFLVELKREGKVGLIGISTDDQQVLMAALADRRVDAVQCRLQQPPDAIDALSSAAQRGVVVVAREIFGGVAAGSNSPCLPMVRSQVKKAVFNPFVTVALIGTTKQAHLAQSVDSLIRPVEN
jgi:aryl-alcohol dehydrogenase-like predicted oxidoreductase